MVRASSVGALVLRAVGTVGSASGSGAGSAASSVASAAATPVEARPPVPKAALRTPKLTGPVSFGVRRAGCSVQQTANPNAKSVVKGRGNGRGIEWFGARAVALGDTLQR